MLRRINDVHERGGYWLVAEEQDQVLGYCYLAPYRPRYAYRFTLEDSIYLDRKPDAASVRRCCKSGGAGRSRWLSPDHCDYR